MITNLKEDALKPVDEMIDTYGEWLPKNPMYNSYSMDKEKAE